MAINVKLTGADLAGYLADNLTDLEFELLIRERIKRKFDAVHSHNPNLSESYNRCSFSMSWGDEAQWHVSIGETYSKSADMNGQVLDNCMSDVYQLYMMQQGNKLSRLLPAPTPVVDEDDDKKW
jgi:hypothetical protein